MAATHPSRAGDEVTYSRSLASTDSKPTCASCGDWNEELMSNCSARDSQVDSAFVSGAVSPSRRSLADSTSAAS